VVGGVAYLGKDIIVPFIFAVLIAMLLNPLLNLFRRKKIPKVLAILLAIFVAFIVIAILVIAISLQISVLSESFPDLEKKFRSLVNEGMNYLNNHYNISEVKVNKWLDEKQKELLNKSGPAIGASLAQVGGAILNLVILPVYVFLILWYKSLIVEFIHKVFKESQSQKIGQILSESQRVIQTYLTGLLIEVTIVACLNITGLLIIGIDYALLFGLLGAILNLIPYIGIIIAALLPIGFALLLQSPQHALFVVVLYAIVQFIDNNIIVPKVVASKVRLNALVSILAVLIGGTLWGISGMFLSIPLAAIAKVIFDKIEELEPWAYLMGEDNPDDEKMYNKLLK